MAMDNKRELMGTLGADTDSQFERHSNQLSTMGISLAWRRGRGANALPSSGNVALLFPTKWLIDEMESRQLESLIVAGWAQSDFDTWEKETHPDTLVIEKG